MRRWLLVGVMALGLGLGGCVSPEQREKDIETAAVAAGKEAREAAYAEAIKLGKSEEEAAKVATEAGKIAYHAAKKAAEKIPQSGGLGQVLSSLLYVLVNVGLPLLGKGGGA